MKQKMKKMMTGRKISTSEDVYSHSTHTQILHAIPHSHSFAFVCKPTFFLPECNKAGLLFASGCNSWYFDIVQQSFLIYILKYILNFLFIIEFKDDILDRITIVMIWSNKSFSGMNSYLGTFSLSIIYHEIFCCIKEVYQFR